MQAATGLGKEFEKLRIAVSDKDKKIAELEATCKDYSSLQHRFSVALQDLTRAKVEEEMAIKEREAALKSLEQERQTSERAIQSERDTMRNNSLFGDAAMRSLEAERDSVVRALQQAKVCKLHISLVSLFLSPSLYLFLPLFLSSFLYLSIYLGAVAIRTQFFLIGLFLVMLMSIMITTFAQQRHHHEKNYCDVPVESRL